MSGRNISQEMSGPAGENFAEVARRRLRGRNLAMLGLLGGMSILFYLLTFILMGGRGS